MTIHAAFPSTHRRWLVAFCLLLLILAQVAKAVEIPESKTSHAYTSRDTLQIAPDTNPDANDCLEGLGWDKADFAVDVASQQPDEHFISVSFPSPKPCGIELIDQVTCEWYPAKDKVTGKLLVRPAMIIVHESGSGMQVGKLIASDLGRRGLHAFLVQLPGYGKRKSPGFKHDDLISVFAQGVCDVRRARDAVAAIPQVDSRYIGLQGTSLGGFVATLSGSLDEKFDGVFLLLCGGDLHGVLTHGAKDAKKSLDRLVASGVPADEARNYLQRIEPLRIAHRLSPERTWLYSGTFDDVVPPKYSDMLAEAVHLPPERHIRMLATHYSGLIFMPGILEKISQTAEQPSR